MTSFSLAFLAALAFCTLLAWAMRVHDDAPAGDEPNFQPVKPKESVYRRPDPVLYTQKLVKDSDQQGAVSKPARKDQSMTTLFRLLLSIPQTLMAGFVFSHMWNWFIVRKFPTIPHMGVMDSVGLLMVAGFPLLGLALMNARKEIQEKHPDVNDDAVGIAVSVIVTVIIYPMILGVSWIWSQIIGS